MTVVPTPPSFQEVRTPKLHATSLDNARPLSFRSSNSLVSLAAKKVSASIEMSIKFKCLNRAFAPRDWFPIRGTGYVM